MSIYGEFKSLIKDHKLLINFASLSTLLFSRYFLSILIIPYLIYALGLHLWGLIAFSIAFIRVSGSLIEFGFQFSISRDVIELNNRKSIQNTVSNVIGAKILLAALVIILFLPLLVYTNVYQGNYHLLAIVMTWSIIYGMNMKWYLYAKEKISKISLLEAKIRLLQALLIIIFIKSEEDFIFVLISYVLVSLVITIYSYIDLIRENYIIIPKLIPTISIIKSSYKVFLQRFSVNQFRTGGAFLMGMFAPIEYVGVYSAIEKIVLALAAFPTALNISIFPKINKLIRKKINSAYYTVINTIIFNMIYGVIIIVFLNYYSEWVLNIFFGASITENSIYVLTIMSVIPLLVSINNTLSVQYMLPMRKDMYYLVVSLFIMVFGLYIISSFVPIYFDVGMSLSIIIIEGLLLTITMSSFFHDKDKILR